MHVIVFYYCTLGFVFIFYLFFFLLFWFLSSFMISNSKWIVHDMSLNDLKVVRLERCNQIQVVIIISSVHANNTHKNTFIFTSYKANNIKNLCFTSYTRYICLKNIKNTKNLRKWIRVPTMKATVKYPWIAMYPLNLRKSKTKKLTLVAVFGKR